MHALTSKRNYFAACLVGVGLVVANTNAAGQSMADAGATDAGASACPAPTVSDAGFSSTPWSGPTTVPTDPGAITLDDGAVPAYCAGDVFTVLGVTNPNVPGFAFTSVQAPYADAAGCAAFDSQGHPAAMQCLCANCFTVEQQCDALPGCRAIHKCELDSGCTDPNSCYFAGACSAVIDLWGTGSVATALTNTLGTCGKAHSCPPK